MDTPHDFESIKQINVLGREYWSARSLMALLGYGKNSWHDFASVIEKAKKSCERVGLNVEDHFYSSIGTANVVSRSESEVEDYFLSKRACYLIAMNGDVRKPEVAATQNYFAFTTETSGELVATSGELTASWNLLKGTEILDVMGSEGLAANLFRITQTDAKLKRDKVADEDTAILTHHDVGQEVRQAIENIHQKKPEDLPRAASIRKLVEEKRRKTRKKLKNPPPDEQNMLF
jgi:DNA-damage-inducible protein D